eukprot:NODE_775_length_778_cov_30.440329_g592_i0.p1 GENE.NODE_775_length_778_cov_30.440329_g592_i0~~NODE_775_length_778_cov_30.440329_g592_i0.p1  ORF type:complete len:217 (-),score=20.67 NODE_775_length_778_cov_30.440329_g592_i0:68-718(-)
MQTIKHDLRVDHVDLLLVHWPSGNGVSTDPLCSKSSGKYDEKACRMSTWKAMEIIFRRGDAKAIGVSNYKVEHLQEFIDAGVLLPSVNQCPFHAHNSMASPDKAAMIKFCKKHDITFAGYSPLGVPDLHKFSPPMTRTLLTEPVALRIAKAHNVTAAQVYINWQWHLGIPVNPRTMNTAHMREALTALDFSLTEQDLQALGSIKQCPEDSGYPCKG